MTGGSEVRVERVERVAGACREGGPHARGQGQSGGAIKDL